MAISTDDARTGLEQRPRKERPGRELVADAFRVVADPVVVALLCLRMPPPAVVLVHTAVGLAAAIAIGSGRSSLPRTSCS